MSASTYERDPLAWAEHQAELLSHVAVGERVNEPLDWPHIIEEVRDVGLSELRACESLLVQALAHLLKLHAWPDSDAAAHWRGETAAFLAGAGRKFTPSMRQRIDLQALYLDALYEVCARYGDAAAAAVFRAACPFALDDLIAERPDLTRLTGVLAAIDPRL